MEQYHWLALRAVPQVGNVTFRRLLERFGDPARVLCATAEELTSVPGVSAAVVAGIKGGEWRRAADQEAARVAQLGVTILTLADVRYPKLLLQLTDAPPLLYLRGLLPTSPFAVAMVGSRRASTYGLTTTERFAFDLSSRGITVVSGMARGIDTAAHRGALKGGSATIGVLGCGIDVVYPAESRRLFSEMAEQGALLSEFPIATPPLAENFPRRNRIISGLSHGVLVVEAAEGSGSLITAQYALEQGRDVYAVPGNIGYVGSCGTNRLIKDGAKLVTSVEDIMDELPGMQRASAGVTVSQIPLAPGEEAVVTLLGQTPCHIDEIIAGSALTVGEVSAMLLRLELKGAVKQLPGKHYVRP